MRGHGRGALLLAIGAFLLAMAPTSASAGLRSAEISLPDIYASDYGLPGVVSCPSASFCAAIDVDSSAARFLTSVSPTAADPDWTASELDQIETFPRLYGVSCPSAGFCAVIGRSQELGAAILTSTDPGAERPAWTVSSLPEPLYSLDSISCPSVNLCLAYENVGTVGGGDDIGAIQVTSTDPASATPHWRVDELPVSIGNLACLPGICSGAVDRLFSTELMTRGLMVNTSADASPDAWRYSDIVDPTRGTTASCASTSLCIGMGWDYEELGDTRGFSLRSGDPLVPSPDWEMVDQPAGRLYSDPVCPTTGLCLADEFVPDDAGGKGAIVAIGDPSSPIGEWEITPLYEHRSWLPIPAVCQSRSTCTAYLDSMHALLVTVNATDTVEPPGPPVSTPAEPPSPPVTYPTCPKLTILGARGSGEPAGLGHPVGEFARLLKRQLYEWRGIGFYATTPLDYPAVRVDPPHTFKNLLPIDLEGAAEKGLSRLFGSAYEHSLDTGRSHLRGALVGNPCLGQTWYVLAGYSQGAEVVDDVLAAGLPRSVRKRTVAVVLFGDPKYNSRDSDIHRFGRRNAPQQGVRQARRKGSLAGAAHSFPILSYCHGNDLICNFDFRRPQRVFDLPGKGHTDYPARGVADAADRVAALLRRR